MILYQYFARASWVFFKFYFKEIEINGRENLPPKGEPYIMSPNHQNAFLDGVVMASHQLKPMYFLARSDAFKKPWNKIMRAIYQIPVYRMRDGFSNLSKNDVTFNRCAEVMAEGSGILLFPEGNQDEVHYLRPLSKGIARIALGSQESIGNSIHIIPIGLNYFNHFSSGRKLVINYGKSFPTSEFKEEYKANKNKAYRKFMQKLKPAMLDTLIIPTESEDYQIQKTLFTRKNEKLNFFELKNLALKNISFPPDKSNKFLKLITEILKLPNFGPFLLLRHANTNWLKRRTFHASMKLGITVVILPIWFLFCFLICLLMFNWKVALIVFLVQILSLIVRSKLTPFVHV